jgi:NAD(P)-dependent dehydrogenase (short-subunit alcohol dehydrogenase family)
MTSYNAYCVSKAGLNMLSRGFALELRERDILVNTVDPGVARTEMNTTASEPAESVVPIVRTLACLPRGGPTGCFFKKSGDEIAV